MGELERLVSAFGSRDLRDRRIGLQDRRRDASDITRLGALGLAARHRPLAVAVFELRYRAPADGAPRRALFRFVQDNLVAELLARGRRAGWHLRRAEATSVVLVVLLWWLVPRCPRCEGRGYVVVPGTRRLSDHQCGACHGVGRPGLYDALRARPARWYQPAEWLAGRLGDLEGRAGDEYIRRLAEDARCLD